MNKKFTTKMPFTSLKKQKFNNSNKITNNLADKIMKFSTFNKTDIIKEKKSSKKPLKIVRKIIKKRKKFQKPKSLMN